MIFQHNPWGGGPHLILGAPEPHIITVSQSQVFCSVGCQVGRGLPSMWRSATSGDAFHASFVHGSDQGPDLGECYAVPTCGNVFLEVVQTSPSSRTS